MKKLYQFNSGLIRQLKNVLIDRLQKAKTELVRIKQNEIRVEDVIQGINNDIHTVTNNLRMAKLPEYEFAQKIENVLNLIKNKNAPPESLDVVIETIGVFSEYLSNKIDKLSRNGENDFYPMELWNEWEKLKNLLEEKAKPQDLFYPFAEFDEEEAKYFSNADPSLLREKTMVAYQDYVDNANEWLNCQASNQDIYTAKTSLKKMYNVVKFFTELKTKIGYQGYLLALQARLLMAFSNENAELDKKKNLTQIIQASIQELQSFRNSEKHPSQQSLKITLERFLINKYYENIKDEKIIKEVLDRFNILKFLEKASLVVNKEEKLRKDEFKRHFNNIKKTVEAAISSFEQIKESYNLNKREDEDHVVVNKKDIETYLVFSNSLLKYNILINEEVRDIFNSFVKLDKTLREKISKGEIDISNDILTEFGGLFYIFTIYLDNKEDVDKKFIDLFKKQAIRAEKSLSYEKKFLLTNFLDWSIIGRNSYKENYRKIYKNLKDLISITITDFYELIDKNNKDKAQDMVIRLSHILAILVMAKLNAAAKLIDYLRNVIITKIKTDKYIFEEEQRIQVIKILQNTEVFSEALEKGDDKPNLYIKSIYEEIFKENIEDKIIENELEDKNYQANESYENYLEDNKEITKKSSMSINVVDKPEEMLDKPEAVISYVDKNEMMNNFKEKISHEYENTNNVVIIDNKQIEENINNYEQQDINNEEDFEVEESTNVDYEEVIFNEESLDNFSIWLEQYHEEYVPVVNKNGKKLKDLSLSISDYEIAKKEVKRIAHSLKGDTRQLQMNKIGGVFEIIEFFLKDKLGNGKYLSKNFVIAYLELFEYALKYIEEIETAIQNNEKEVKITIDHDIVNLYAEEIRKYENEEANEEANEEELDVPPIEDADPYQQDNEIVEEKSNEDQGITPIEDIDLYQQDNKIVEEKSNEDQGITPIEDVDPYQQDNEIVEEKSNEDQGITPIEDIDLYQQDNEIVEEKSNEDQGITPIEDVDLYQQDNEIVEEKSNEDQGITPIEDIDLYQQDNEIVEELQNVNVVEKVIKPLQKEIIELTLNNDDIDHICKSLENISNEILNLSNIFKNMKK